MKKWRQLRFFKNSRENDYRLGFGENQIKLWI